MCTGVVTEFNVGYANTEVQRYEPKKSFRLVEDCSIWEDGGPNTSMMQASCSTSFSPGNSG